MPDPSSAESEERRREIEESIEAGHKHGLEVLATGGLLTFHGRHHKTGNYFKWLDRNPQVVGPEAAPLVTKEQVAEFLAWVTKNYGASDAPGNRRSVFKMSGRGPDALDGLVTPTCGVNRDGSVIMHGREAHLRDLAFQIVRCNPNRLWSANGEGDAVRRNLEDIMISEVIAWFKASAQMSGRWTQAFLESQAQEKVRRNVRMFLAGRIAPDHRYEDKVTADREEAAKVAAQRAEEAKRKEEKVAKLKEVWGGDTPYVPLGADDSYYYFLNAHRQVQQFNSARLTTVSGLLGFG